jgi:hypothetical protein
MAMIFDATLKHMGRDSPTGVLTAFDHAPTLPVKLLNVDLSTVTTAADLILGLGDPPQEIIHFEFQSSAAAGKHADLMVYNVLLFAHYRVPVHSRRRGRGAPGDAGAPTRRDFTEGRVDRHRPSRGGTRDQRSAARPSQETPDRRAFADGTAGEARCGSKDFSRSSGHA